MSLSSSGFSYLTTLLQEYYMPRMIEAAKLRRYIINYLEKYRQVEQIGASATVGAILAWAESVSAGSSTSVLPAPLDPEGATYKVTTKNLYGLLQVWKTEIAQANNDMKAFVKAQQTKIETITKATQAEAEIFCYGDGGATPRCVCSAASNSSDTVTLTCDSTRLLRRGMPVDFKESNASAITNGSYVQVKSIISETQFTVTLGTGLGAAFAAAAADAYVFHANNKDLEPYGLEALIGKTTQTNIFGINRTAVGSEWFNSLVKKIDATGAMVAATGPSAAGTAVQAWDMKYLWQLLEILISQRQAPKDKLAIFTTDSIRTKIVNDNNARGIAMPLMKEVDVWPVETVAMNGVPIVSSYLIRPGAIFIPCLNTFTKFETEKFAWDENGGMWKQAYDQATARPIPALYAWFAETYEMAVGDATQSAALYDCEGAY